jgi:hypothetical protein
MSYHQATPQVKRSIAKETEYFRRTLRDSGVSSDGEKWALLALDPFHDTQLEVVGKCDSQIGRSLLYDIRKDVTITKDAGLAAGNWDCHVAFIPSCRMCDSAGKVSVFSPINGVAPPCPNGFVYDEEVATALPDGVVVCCQVASGGDTFDPSSAANFYTPISIDSFLQPNARHNVVSAALEVHNTTAEIEKQGSVTAYRHENSYLACGFGVSGANFPSMVSNAPPRTVGLAKEIGGVTWDAAEGVLLPLAFSRADATPGAYVPKLTVLVQDNGYLFANNALAGGAFLPSGFDLGMDASGAYFTGLSDGTSLTVTLRMVMEVFPEPSSDLMALAHPSPPVDYHAMQLVSRIQATLKPGYPVDENGFGDFFRGIAGAIGKVVPIAAKAIGTVIPKARAITGPVAALATEIGKAAKKKK